MQLPRENRQLSGVAPPPSDVEGQLDKVKSRLHQCFVIFLVFPLFVFTLFLADFLTHRGLVSGKRACAGKFQRFKSDQLQLTPTQPINFVQLLFFVSIRREQDSTTSHFRVTRARSDSISRRSNLCLYFLLMVLKGFCCCGLSVPCQVLCNFKDHNAEQALNTVWKNTAAAIRFSFFTLKTA